MVTLLKVETVRLESSELWDLENIGLFLHINGEHYMKWRKNRKAMDGDLIVNTDDDTRRRHEEVENNRN